MLASLGHSLQSRVLGGIGWLRFILLQRYYAYTLPIGLVIVTIALTIVSTLIIINKGILGLAVVGVVAGLLVFIISYNYHGFGAILLVVVSTVVNFELQRDLTITLFVVLLLLFTWFIKMVFVDQSFVAIRPAAPNKFVFLFALAVIVSYIWSSFYVDPDVSFFQSQKLLPRTLTAIVLMASPLIMLFYGNVFKSVKIIEYFVWFYIYFGCFMGIGRLIQLSLPTFFNGYGQLGVWTCLLALGQLLFNRSLKNWQILLLAGGIGAWGYIAIGLGISWLSGWVPLVLGIVIIILLRSRTLFILAITAILCVAFVKREVLMDAFFEEKEISGDTRAEAAGTVFNIAGEHYLFGTGPAGYYFYMMVNVGGLFQLSHNNYFDIFAQTGIFGIVVWVGLWLSVGWIAWRVFRSRPANSFVRGLSISLTAIYPVTLMLMMLGDWITPFTYTQSLKGISYTIWPWMWAGIALALYHMLRESKLEEIS